jgi:hypothetical protein
MNANTKSGQPALDVSTPFKALVAATFGAPGADLEAVSIATLIRSSAGNPASRFEGAMWLTLKPLVTDLFQRIETAVIHGDRGPLDRLTAACIADFECSHGAEPNHPVGVLISEKQARRKAASASDLHKELASKNASADSKTLRKWATVLGYKTARVKPGPKRGSSQKNRTK